MRSLFLSLGALAIVGICAGTPHLLSAQSRDVALTITPELPGPNEEVTAKLETIGFEMSRASVTWRKNGEVIEGSDGRRVTLETGPAGSDTTITAHVTLADSSRLTARRTLQTAAIDMVWEADTYTPPLYKGKARYTPMANATVAAIPRTGGVYNADNLLYEWKVDGRRVAERTAGKNSYAIRGSAINQDRVITARVYTPGGVPLAQQSMSLSSVSPEVQLYSQTTDTSVQYTHALSDAVTLDEQRLNVLAIPYFFSTTAPVAPSLDYTWSMNNTRFTTSYPPHGVTLERPNDTQGRARVSVSVRHQEKVSQNANAQATIRFGRTTAPTPQ